MSLNNQITTKKFEKEKMDDEQNKMKGQQEEETAKQLYKTSKMGRILFAIDNLYNKCLNSKSQLKWRIPNEVVNQVTRANRTKNPKTESAIKQLEVISDYYEDFDEVIKELRKKFN
jgi:hypothetical protein